MPVLRVPAADNDNNLVIARTAQEAIVVNLDGLNWSEVRIRAAGEDAC
jgi:hypothetical protein